MLHSSVYRSGSSPYVCLMYCFRGVGQSISEVCFNGTDIMGDDMVGNNAKPAFWRGIEKVGRVERGDDGMHVAIGSFSMTLEPCPDS